MAFAKRRIAEGKSKREVRRCLKRTVTRQLYRLQKVLWNAVLGRTRSPASLPVPGRPPVCRCGPDRCGCGTGRAAERPRAGGAGAAALSTRCWIIRFGYRPAAPRGFHPQVHFRVTPTATSARTVLAAPVPNDDRGSCVTRGPHMASGAELTDAAHPHQAVEGPAGASRACGPSARPARPRGPASQDTRPFRPSHEEVTSKDGAHALGRDRKPASRRFAGRRHQCA